MRLGFGYLAPRHRSALILLAFAFAGGLVLSTLIAAAAARWAPLDPTRAIIGQPAADATIVGAWTRLRPEGYPQRPDRIEFACASPGYGIAVLSVDLPSPRTQYSATVLRTGWPFAAFEGARWTTMRYSGVPRPSWQVVDVKTSGVGPRLTVDALMGPRTTVSQSRFIPVRPVVGGTLANALLLGLIVALPWLPRTIRRWRRERSGRCVACAYPAGDSACCTECGRRLAEDVRHRARMRSR